MAVEDMQITRQVRGVLARNWVDTRRMDYSVIGRTVYLRGQFRVTAEASGAGAKDDSAFLARMLFKIDEEIRRIREVKGIIYNLAGWERVGQGWRRLGGRKEG